MSESSSLSLVDSPSSIYSLTVTVAPSRIPTLKLCSTGGGIRGSLVVLRQSTQALLELAGEKKIVQTITMVLSLTREGVEEVMGSLREGGREDEV